MTPEEFKKMQDEQTAKVAALESKNADLEAKLAEKDTAINNLDASVKEQEKSIAALRESVKAGKATDWKSALRIAMEEKKAELEAAWKSGDKKGVTIALEVKTDPAAIGTGNISPNGFLGVAVDPTIYAANPPANAFLAAFGQRPCVGNKLGWIEATTNGASVVGYVAELAQNTNKADVSFVEKSRKYAKLATTMQISTEFADWFEMLYDYCVNEGQRLLEAKFDNEVFNGDGSDSSHPTDVYGLKGAATAFSALNASNVVDANEADVIADAAMQIAKEGFNANVAFVTWAEFAAIKALKDQNGNYLYNQLTGVLNGIRILPSTRLSSGEMLIADTAAASVYGGGNSYELEIIRNGAYDANDVYFRKRCQVKVATSSAKGLIYVSNVATAKAALHKDSAVGASVAELAKASHIFKTQEQTTPGAGGDGGTD